jgi:succinate-semialdehyde dehydrogenase/glutarate-semialdehyde dehydrogenase
MMATDLHIPAPTVIPGRVVSANPATGEILREFECATEAQVQAAVARARAAQPAWNEMGVRKRSEILRTFQQLLLEKKSEVARLISQEEGKPCVEALLTEVLVVLDAARFCIENAYDFLRDRAVPHGSLATKTKSGRLLREPYGAIAIISPWNYPFSIPATQSLAALVAGNAVVLKPSESTSLCALELGSLFRLAGVPEDLFQIVTGDGATGSALVNAAVDKLILQEACPQANGSRKRPPHVCCRSFWSWAEKIQCWCSMTPT